MVRKNTLGYNYYAVALTKSSKEILISYIKEGKGVCGNLFSTLYEMLEKVYCDHHTLMHHSKHNFYVEKLLYSSLDEVVTLKVTHIGFSDKAMAAKLDRGKHISHICTNDIPHITIGTFKEGKPVDSNNIKEWIELDKPILLMGIIKKV
jgi:hypothetical protein